jgi:hypothetical protein
MTAANPIRTGCAVAATVAIGYTACALVFWLWPEAAANYMNALFHGLDFRKLQSGPGSFGLASFLYALAVTVVWAFLLGLIFGAMQDWFGNRGASRSPTR